MMRRRPPRLVRAAAKATGNSFGERASAGGGVAAAAAVPKECLHGDAAGTADYKSELGDPKVSGLQSNSSVQVGRALQTSMMELYSSLHGTCATSGLLTVEI